MNTRVEVPEMMKYVIDSNFDGDSVNSPLRPTWKEPSERLFLSVTAMLADSGRLEPENPHLSPIAPWALLVPPAFDPTYRNVKLVSLDLPPPEFSQALHDCDPPLP
jgi:hypothetical protein